MENEEVQVCEACGGTGLEDRRSTPDGELCGVCEGAGSVPAVSDTAAPKSKKKKAEVVEI